jgi:hypothetical protein
MSQKTVSEELFERYLESQGLAFEFEKQYEGKSRRPDYTVAIGGKGYLFEVKEFEPGDMPLGTSQFDPYPPIRAKIDAARKKFKEFEGFPCCLVLHNKGAFVMTERPYVMLGAMYGDAGFKLAFDPNLGKAVGDPEAAFLGMGKMIRPHWREPENRRITAILTLRHYAAGMRRYSLWWDEIRRQIKAGAIDPDATPEPDFDIGERGLGVLVWDNAFAEIPLPLNVFRGPYDERWSVVDNDQRLTFRGAGIVAVEPDSEPQSLG